MADIGEIRAVLVAETEAFEKGLDRASDKVDKFSGEAEKNFDRLNDSLKSINWREAGEGIARVGSTLKSAGDEFLRAAERADDLADKLQGAFGDSAGQVADWSQQIGTAFQVFSAEQVGGAATALNKFGEATEANLRRVADIAAGSGQSIESVAVAFGKFEKFGDSKSLMALQKQLGVTADELGRFGAVLDSNGKILADTPARAEAARAAMEALLDEKFGGAMERQADASARLAGSTELLKQELGEAALQAKEAMAPALLSIVDGLRGMSPEMKGAIGLITEFGGAGLEFAGTGLQMAANLKALGLGLTSIQTALAAAQGGLSAMAAGLVAVSGPALILIGTLGALAVGLAALTAATNEQTKAEEALLAIEEKRVLGLAKNADLIGKNAEEIKKLGKGVKEVDELIAGLHDQMERARAQGLPQAQQDRLAQQLATARAARSDLLQQNPNQPVYNKPAAPPPTPGEMRIEESEKERKAREKKQAAERERQRKKQEADRKKAEAERERARKKAEAQQKAADAKRQREQRAAERKREAQRKAEERKREREKQKAEKERERAEAKRQKDSDKKQADDKQKSNAASKAASAPTAAADLGSLTSGYADTFTYTGETYGLDQLGASMKGRSAADLAKEQQARNRARAESVRVFTSEPAARGAVGFGLDAMASGLDAVSSLAGTALGGGGTKAGAPAGAGEQVAEALESKLDAMEITVKLESPDGRTQASTKRGRDARKFEFKSGLGGLT